MLMKNFPVAIKKTHYTAELTYIIRRNNTAFEISTAPLRPTSPWAHPFTLKTLPPLPS